MAFVEKLTDVPREIELSSAKITTAAGLKLASASEVVVELAVATFGAATGETDTGLGTGLAIGLVATGGTTLGFCNAFGTPTFIGVSRTKGVGALTTGATGFLVCAGAGFATGFGVDFATGAGTGAGAGLAAVTVFTVTTAFAQTVTEVVLVVEP